MHERNTFLKFITLVCELMISTNCGLSKSVVKLSQARENFMKEVIINYLYMCLVMCIYAVYVEMCLLGKRHMCARVHTHTRTHCVLCLLLCCS